MYYVIGLAWIYEIINVLFFSIDYFIISKNIPIVSGAFEYKFIFLVFISVFYSLKYGTIELSLLVLKFLFFPFIFIFNILKIIHKNDWYFFLFSAFGGIVSFLDGLKYRIINCLFFCLSIAFAFTHNNKYTSIISMVFAFLFLAVSYIRAIIDSIKTPFFYKTFDRLLSFWTNRLEGTKMFEDEYKETEGEIIIINHKKIVSSTFGGAIMTSGVYSFLSNVINKYKDQNIRLIFNISIFIYLLFCIIFSMSIMNYDLWKASPQEFQVTGDISFFDFVFYSCREMAFADVDNLKASMVCSKSIQIIDNFTFVFLGAVICIAIFTNKNDKFTKENEKLLTNINRYRDSLNSKICSACDVSDISTVKEELNNVNESLYKIFQFLTKSI
ncbi:hypothetical protein [Acetobacter oryzifermentans]|uniref:Uncharacterized protein n=1 Tax=Acetobacter oryzifermentans TaxID=1633874 RepID=A0ABN4NRG1_9PROT|nr:hypothetical protein [Acetobacter oryzifermentans]ANA12747.1 hypothetical protein WG31_00885 [Acetobacter oryzifermentans]